MRNASQRGARRRSCPCLCSVPPSRLPDLPQKRTWNQLEEAAGKTNWLGGWRGAEVGSATAVSLCRLCGRMHFGRSHYLHPRSTSSQPGPPSTSTHTDTLSKTGAAAAGPGVSFLYLTSPWGRPAAARIRNRTAQRARGVLRGKQDRRQQGCRWAASLFFHPRGWARFRAEMLHHSRRPLL